MLSRRVIVVAVFVLRFDLLLFLIFVEAQLGQFGHVQIEETNAVQFIVEQQSHNKKDICFKQLLTALLLLIFLLRSTVSPTNKNVRNVVEK